ncbi:paraben-hydrolyzing esterase precursor [Macroventuria anomochaeta]|uniref:Paraben-hydrolyzing esterase n=1 Tax=Macroventuria anomochaeta TaxID=301207 RepID=A0ACB6S5J8_9PLEO|nr:paraben-hydrolyzing esterase precursor [Macroventuria anomochaeta]KAF2628664.1 paraben-hydrolyzing esterase precursor [Macroventuria anomochaeta]
MSKPSRPYLRDLQFRGVVEGLTYLDDKSKPLCHFFGGVPFGLPPVGPFRFQKPRSLPTCYRYGTKSNPGRFTGSCGLCPQITRQGLDDHLWEEDCLQSNIWVPIGEPPKGGWPVLFYIHGGFLQFGNPNDMDMRAFLSDSPTRCIVVAPAYRLNLFGFLSSSELLQACPDFTVNLGFWDQRLALRWTWENISYFGGNPSNITVSGYSAGAHSVFHQLAYDLGVPDKKAIVKRALMLSNGPGMQPKSLDESTQQFNEFLTALSIPLKLRPSEKLVKLRALPAKTLISASNKIKIHQFRAVTDGTFVRPNLIGELSNGKFAQRLKRRNVKIMMGECSQEHFLYGTWKPPKSGFDNLLHRLEADYPQAAVEVLMKHYFPDRTLPKKYRSWGDAFGHVYADVQIHALERGMANALIQHSAGDLLHRYRIEWRAKCVDEKVPKKYGPTHTTDLPIWFWGNGDDLTVDEKNVVTEAFQKPLAQFLKGEEVQWGTRDDRQIRTLKETGHVVIEDDESLQEGLELWKALSNFNAPRRPRESML